MFGRTRWWRKITFRTIEEIVKRRETNKTPPPRPVFTCYSIAAAAARYASLSARTARPGTGLVRAPTTTNKRETRPGRRSAPRRRVADRGRLRRKTAFRHRRCRPRAGNRRKAREPSARSMATTRRGARETRALPLLLTYDRLLRHGLLGPFRRPPLADLFRHLAVKTVWWPELRC